jgi:hypothetical protein
VTFTRAALKIPAPGQLPDGNMKQLGVNLMSPLFPFTFDQNISLSDPAGFGVNSLFYSSTSYNFGCPTCYNLVGYNGILTSITVSDTTLSVPEPSTWAVMLAGLFGIGFAGRIRRDFRFARMPQANGCRRRVTHDCEAPLRAWPSATTSRGWRG